MQKMVKKQRQCIYARIQAYSLELTVAQHMRQPVGGVAAQASGLIGLENGRGPDEGPAGFENARHVPDQQVRILDMMKHLLTEDEVDAVIFIRSEEHTSELQSLMRSSYAVFCLKKKNKKEQRHTHKNKQT